jgi:uncharacterized protein with PhoU and TrkA domain
MARSITDIVDDLLTNATTREEAITELEAKVEDLRDQFAMAALSSLRSQLEPGDVYDAAEVANTAFAIADAMMVARG